MPKVLIVKKLQSLVIAYEGEMASPQRAIRSRSGNSCSKTKRAREIDLEYQALCDRFSLYERFGFPFYIEDVFKHALLVDEILNGILFAR